MHPATETTLADLAALDRRSPVLSLEARLALEAHARRQRSQLLADMISSAIAWLVGRLKPALHRPAGRPTAAAR